MQQSYNHTVKTRNKNIFFVLIGLSISLVNSQMLYFDKQLDLLVSEFRTRQFCIHSIL